MGAFVSHPCRSVERMFGTLLEELGQVIDGASDDVLRELSDDEIAQLTEELLLPTDQGSDGWRPSMADTVLVMQSQARLVAHHHARMLETMNMLVAQYRELADGDLAAAMEGAVAEIRCALNTTRRSAETHVDMAWRLGHRLPAVGRALFAGDIDVARARAIAYGTDHLDRDHARQIADVALQQAGSLTSGQLQAFVRRLCVESDPDESKQRYDEAVSDRKVTAELTVDGTGTIVASDLPAEHVAAVMDRIDRIAHDLVGTGEHRTIDQLRADVFVDLLTGGASGILPRVDVTVDLETLAGLADRAADLGGLGPVISDIARHMASTYGARWRYAVTDGAGTVLVAGATKRRPSAAVRREVEMRDRTCVFPGCRRPARRSDLDHITPYSEGGATTPGSLAACCRHDHVVRHRFDWSYVRNPDGSYTWTAPSGNRYTRPPPV